MQVLEYLKEDFRERDYFIWFLVLLIFLMVFSPRWLPYGIAVSGLSWAFSKNLPIKLNALFRNKWFLLILAFYILHVLGLLYSQNLHEGKLDLQTKLSLIVLPIVFFSSENSIRKRKGLLTGAYVVSVIAAAVLCFLMSFYKAYQNAGDEGGLNFDVYGIYTKGQFLTMFLNGHSYLNYGFLSHFIHVNYFSMYIALAIYLVYLRVFNEGHSGRFILSLASILFMLFTLLLLQSRSGLIAIFAVIVFESALQLKKPGNRLLKACVIASIGLILLVSVLNTQRFRLLLSGIVDRTEIKDDRIRLVLWAQSVPLIKENFLIGVGTGDVRDTYQGKYKSLIMIGDQEKYLNYHNEYIETQVRLGISGLLILLALIFSPFYRKNNYGANRLLIGFTLIIAVSFFFESMLVRLNGVVFFALFYSLLHATENEIYQKKIA